MFRRNSEPKRQRPKFWWVWPDFFDETDARDAAKGGVTVCSIMAIGTGVVGLIQYFADGNPWSLTGTAIEGILYAFLGYGIFNMYQSAAFAALALYSIETAYMVLFDGGRGGVVRVVFVWSFVQTCRAVLWFNDKDRGVPPIPPRLMECPSCGFGYNANDYNQDAAMWLCAQCNGELQKT